MPQSEKSILTIDGKNIDDYTDEEIEAILTKFVNEYEKLQKRKFKKWWSSKDDFRVEVIGPWYSKTPFFEIRMLFRKFFHRDKYDQL